MIYNCDCPICNSTAEAHEEAEQSYIEWYYKQYCKETKTPLPMEKWLESLATKNKD